MRATGAPLPSGGRTIVTASTVSWRAVIGAVANRFSRSARTSGVHGRLVPMATSAAIRARLARQAVPHRLDHRAQRDDRPDADGDADEEEEEPAPRRADLAPRHQQDETHDLPRGCRPSDSPTRALARRSAPSLRGSLAFRSFAISRATFTPSDSPTRALARRFAGSLRLRGSLASLVRIVTRPGRRAARSSGRPSARARGRA